MTPETVAKLLPLLALLPTAMLIWRSMRTAPPRGPMGAKPSRGVVIGHYGTAPAAYIVLVIGSQLYLAGH